MPYGVHEYYTIGYVPFPQSHGCVSQTLEYVYDDWCAYMMAKESGNKFYEEVFARSLYNYRNLWDANTGFFRGRGIDGKFLEPFDPLAWGGPYTEGNAWHYIWSVFHDVQGLINLYGSDQKFVEKMDSVFSQPATVHPGWYGGKIHEMVEMEEAKMGQYAHGLYAVTPGTNQYVIGSPLFRKATITMEDGKKFVIEADGNSADNVYIQSGTLNGRQLDKNFITYDDIARGGSLKFVMGAQPNKSRNTTKAASPYSLSAPVK